MRITLRPLELELDMNKIDTPTGAGWCVVMPDERKLLVKFHHRKWDTHEVMSDDFVQVVGNEVSRFLEAEQSKRIRNKHSLSNGRSKRARILKYFLIYSF